LTSTLEPPLSDLLSGTGRRAAVDTAPPRRLPPHDAGSLLPGGPKARPAALTHARQAAGLTVTQLARALHVTRPTVSMWESGDRRAARCYWDGLATALRLDLAEVSGLFVGYPTARDDRVLLPGLARARRRARLTQRSLAERIGVATTTLSMWEVAGIPVPTALTGQLEQLLATDLDELLLPPPQRTVPDPRPLRRLRREAGMSQREAAAHLRIAIGSLARYEAGERVPPLPVVRRMAAAYRRPVGELLSIIGHELVPLPPGASWGHADVPEAIRSLRTNAGLSKDGLGRLLGRSGQAVRSWETGRSRPMPATLRRLEVLFGLPVGRFAE
jgi:transcriptional regulator with XRE-family HTH domain